MRLRIILISSLFILSLSPLFGQEKRYVIPIENSPSYGPADAPVTIIEFIDYQ
ncbi:MAG: hypothetical protein N2257_04860 [Thermodesulfovibrionales bacterium]|nr:hypothetical protein [Thermodesulfovibrionales bacterium]